MTDPTLAAPVSAFVSEPAASATVAGESAAVSTAIEMVGGGASEAIFKLSIFVPLATLAISM